jgi:hypothetical protein
MNTIAALVREAERNVAIISAVQHTLSSIKLIHFGYIKIEGTDLIIDLRDDIQRLTAVLILLGAAE